VTIKYTTLVTWLSLALAVGAVMLVKHLWFPAVADVWFQPDRQRLSEAPANVMVFRETRLESRVPGCLASWMPSKPGEAGIVRYMGRNEPLAEVIATAYQCLSSRVVMPPDAPTNHYDFLVTLKQQPLEHLQQAVKKMTGYVAGWQEHDTKVWVLRVRDASAFQESTGGQSNIRFKDGRNYFTHMPINALTGFIEKGLSRPLQDQTGLSGYYDFSVAWNIWYGRELTSDEAVKKDLAEVGLYLDEGTDSMPMMVVHKN
jgi:uncharacterized protein (TIGR03435 family)